MAGGIYKLIVLEPKEGEKKEELLSDFELLERFAPALKTNKPRHSRLIDDWIHAFTTMEALQTGVGVKLEKQDSKQLFDEQLAAYVQAKTALKTTSAALTDALISVLSDITEEQIEQTHKSGAKTLRTVEFYTSKITPTPVGSILKKNAAHLPDYVVKELRVIQDANREGTQQKFGGRSKDTDAKTNG